MIAEEPRVDGTQVTELAQSLEAELARLIVGQKDLLRDTVIALIAGGHVLLEGVPGLGKTVLVRSLGQALSMSFARIQFTPDLMPADIVGTNIIGDEDGHRQFRYQAGPIFANLVLADEINRATLDSVRRYVRWGASPRGLQTLVLASKVRALLEGRYNVAFDDLSAVAQPALRHRVFLQFEAEADGITADRLISEILEHTVKEPARA